MTHQQIEKIGEAVQQQAKVATEQGLVYPYMTITEMADGSRRYGVIGTWQTRVGHEVTLRTEVCPDGEILATETLVLS